MRIRLDVANMIARFYLPVLGKIYNNLTTPLRTLYFLYSYLNSKHSNKNCYGTCRQIVKWMPINAPQKAFKASN